MKLTNIEKVDWIKLFKQHYEPYELFSKPVYCKKEEKEVCPSLETGVKSYTSDCSFGEFVKGFGTLFGPLAPIVDHKARNQKTLCLELYGLYDTTFTIRKECDLPLDALQEFERCWDPLALPRCAECWLPFEGGCRTFCGERCRTKFNCPFGSGQLKCPGCGSELTNVLCTTAHCKTCKFSAPLIPNFPVYTFLGRPNYNPTYSDGTEFVMTPHPPFLPVTIQLATGPIDDAAEVERTAKKPRRSRA